jgi:hypothetical protein
MANTTESSEKVDGKQRARPGAVLRKIAPHQPGAIRLAERYGESLVAVRYRQGQDPRRRVITVELVVDELAVQRRTSGYALVRVRIGLDEGVLRSAAKRYGAKWDPAAKLWTMTRAAARELRLKDRIVESPDPVISGAGTCANTARDAQL